MKQRKKQRDKRTKENKLERKTYKGKQGRSFRFALNFFFFNFFLSCVGIYVVLIRFNFFPFYFVAIGENLE